MKKFTIVINDKIVHRYEAQEQQVFGGPWGSEKATQILIPEAIKLEHAKWIDGKIVEVIPVIPVDELRKKDEIAEGINTETMIEALWEKNMNNKREKADAIKAKKQAIKLKYPKKNIK